MRILVTGGAGYIGSHTLLQLLLADYEVVVFDNFSNSSPEALQRVGLLANATFDVIEGDIRDSAALEKAFNQFQPDAVVHFAGLKAVGESNEQPLEYYSQNVAGSIELLKAMDKARCQSIVFSSSATVYGEAEYLPYDEQHRLLPTNPYGRTKYFIEGIIRDWVAANTDSSAVLLRYFNPVGADASGQIGEDPNGIPNNLAPFIAKVAVGRLPHLKVWGNDYDTRDGTGERDYIHVEDLAKAHLAALKYASGHQGCEAINVGTGQGATVLEMIHAFQAASKQPIPYEIAPRRDGDVARSLASVEKAKRLLNWQAELTIDDMCTSTWAWQSQNPDGYNA